MTIKKVILIFITILAIFRVTSSLLESFNQPQIQSRLELYQTNLVLEAAEFNPNTLDSNFDLTNVKKGLLSNDPYLTAEKQYEKARNEIETTKEKLEKNLNKLLINDLSNGEIKLETTRDILLESELKSSLEEADQLISELNLKIGILEAVRDQNQEAINSWKKVNNFPPNSPDHLANDLQILWTTKDNLPPNLEIKIKDNLSGWFRYQTLVKLYAVEGKDSSELKQKQEIIATEALTKLLIIGLIPLFGGISGVSLLIFLLAQLLIKKGDSLLAKNHDLRWETPWNWEIIWQVLMIGFFFIGQFLLPLIFGISGFNPSGLSLRYKAFYVLVSYLLMATGGIVVLYLSVKEFFPLPKTWFNFNISIKNFFWGFGGYLIALPLVVLISLINQQIWAGQGGSNPILSLALQAQDRVALGIFFITASIAAPIFEELIFRGFLLPSLTRYLPVWGSILVSGLLFAIAHLSISEVLPLTTLGIVLGFVYTRSRNLFSPMILHSLWNSGTLLSLFILGS